MMLDTSNRDNSSLQLLPLPHIIKNEEDTVRTVTQQHTSLTKT